MRQIKLGSNSKNIDPMKSFAEGKEKGFDHFFKAWYKQFCFFAIGFTKNKEAAEDIVSDCFIKVWNKRERFTNESMLKSYFYMAISNACKNHLRNQKRLRKRQTSFNALIETAELPFIHNIIKTETIHLLMQAVDELPGRCKQVLVDLYFSDKSVKEIAQEMNTTESTVRNQESRGLKLLKLRLP